VPWRQALALGSAGALALAWGLHCTQARGGEAAAVLRVKVRLTSADETAWTCRTGPGGTVECAQANLGAGGTSPPGNTQTPTVPTKPVTPIDLLPTTTPTTPTSDPPGVLGPTGPAVDRATRPLRPSPADLALVGIGGRGLYPDAGIAALPGAEQMALAARNGGARGQRDAWAAFGENGQVISNHWDTAAFRISWQVVRTDTHEYIEQTVSW
jgi:hypothetical protein